MAGGPATLGRFPRSARLKRRRLIKPLFSRDQGRGAATDATDGVQSVAAGTIRVVYRLAPRIDTGFDVPVQVGFAVPKRVKRATERNRIKRQMRAGFQANADRYLSTPVPADRTLTMMAIFRGDQFVPDIAWDTKRAVDRVVADLPQASVEAPTDQNQQSK